VVAGPDTTARLHTSTAGSAHVALRFAAGTGPALLGLRAHEVTDRSPALAELWAAAPVRRLTDRVAADPAAALRAWLLARRAEVEPDPLGARLHALAAAGTPVARAAEELGLGERALHRRSLALVGYGPRRLGRVLRLARALDLAGRGVPLAEVATRCGYADQPHLAREARALGGAPVRVLLAERGGAPPGSGAQPGSGANRSTVPPSGSWTTA
jgi:AraC-like DNA-binding protein